MTNQEILQYSYFQNARRSALYREQAAKVHNIQVIRAFIQAGGDPTKNEDTKDEFYRLVKEDGPGVFGVEFEEKVIGFLRPEENTKEDFPDLPEGTEISMF